MFVSYLDKKITKNISISDQDWQTILHHIPNSFVDEAIEKNELITVNNVTISIQFQPDLQPDFVFFHVLLSVLEGDSCEWLTDVFKENVHRHFYNYPMLMLTDNMTRLISIYRVSLQDINYEHLRVCITQLLKDASYF